MNNFKKILSVLTVSMICLSGCGAKNMPVAFTKEDFSSLNKIKKDIFTDQSLNDHIDGVLGLEKYTFYDFLGETTPYTQIALGCIHKGVLNLDQNINHVKRVAMTPELDQCIKEIAQQPVMTEILLTHNLGWTITEAKSNPDVKKLIDEAQKDNVLTVHEFLKIGSLSSSITANSIVESDRIAEADSPTFDENIEKIG